MRSRSACYVCHAEPGQQHAKECEDYPAVVPAPGRVRWGDEQGLRPVVPAAPSQAEQRARRIRDNVCTGCGLLPPAPGEGRNGKPRRSCGNCLDRASAKRAQVRELLARRAAAQAETAS